MDNQKNKAGKYIFISDIPRRDLDLEASNQKSLGLSTVVGMEVIKITKGKFVD